MTTSDLSREIAALTPFLTGSTIELPSGTPGLLPGTTVVAGPTAAGIHEFSGIADASVDAIVWLGDLETVTDWVAEIAQWRRVLVEGGTVAVITNTATPPNGLCSLLLHLGGFDHANARVVTPGQSWLLSARRNQVAEVRQPLGALGPRLAALSVENPAARAELYFQLGTVLIQAGDADLARRCFDEHLELEASSPDGLFGLGMCAGTQGSWAEARRHLTQALLRDPDNGEIQRWIALADEQLAMQEATTPPAQVLSTGATPPAAQPSVQPAVQQDVRPATQPMATASHRGTSGLRVRPQ